MSERLPDELTGCEARADGEHLAIYRAGHRECLWCRRPLDTCCEGEAGREAPPATPADPKPELGPAHLIGRVILDRYS